MASEAYYLTQSKSYDTYAQRWLANILGTNSWGSSFIVGDGSTFSELYPAPGGEPGGRAGWKFRRHASALGSGYGGPANYASTGALEGMNLCPANGVDTFRIFNGNAGAFDASQVAVYRDNTQSYSTRTRDRPHLDIVLMWSWRMAQRPSF